MDKRAADYFHTALLGSGFALLKENLAYELAPTIFGTERNAQTAFSHAMPQLFDYAGRYAKHHVLADI